MPNTAEQSLSVRERLDRERANASRVCAEAFETIRPLTYAEIGASIDRGATRMSVLVDPRNPATLDIARAAMLPVAARRVVAQYVAGSAEMLLIDVPAQSEMVTLADIARSQRSTAAAVTEALDGVADGHLTHAEGMRLEAAADKAIADLWRLRHAARLAQRERVLALPRKAVTA